jgi:hypothetical protein
VVGRLLPILWLPLGLRRNDFDDVLRGLCRAGTLLLMQNTWAGRRWIMPQHLPRANEADMLASWDEATAKKRNEQLTIVISLGHVLPPSVLERTLVACQGLGSFAKVRCPPRMRSRASLA